MSKSKKTRSTRLHGDLDERFQDWRDEQGMTNAQALRTLVREGVDGDEEDQPPRSGASPVTIFGVVALAVAPTLLATGYTALGAVVGVFAAVYALLWATALDIVLEEYVGNARQKLRRAGGLVGFFQLMRSEHPIEDPSTPVERAARLDRWGRVSGVFSVILLAALVAFYYIGYLELVLSLLPTWSIWWVIIMVPVLAYGGAILMGISAIATVAIATARGSAADDEPAAETLGDS